MAILYIYNIYSQLLRNKKLSSGLINYKQYHGRSRQKGIIISCIGLQEPSFQAPWRKMPSSYTEFLPQCKLSLYHALVLIRVNTNQIRSNAWPSDIHTDQILWSSNKIQIKLHTIYIQRIRAPDKRPHTYLIWRIFESLRQLHEDGDSVSIFRFYICS